MRDDQENSFFRELTKYSPGNRSDPRENRLTEAFAAVLRKVDGLGLELVRQWLDPESADLFRGERAASGSVEASDLHALLSGHGAPVLTQVITQKRELLPDPRWVDLELVFTIGEEDRSVRVEVKHGSKPQNGQVHAYRLGSNCEKRVPVVLLAPSRDLPFEDEREAPKEVPQRSWQSTMETVDEFEVSASDPIAAWIRNEFVRFAKEEGLLPMKKISEQMAGQVAGLSRTEQVLRELVACARIEVGRSWGEAEESPRWSGVGAWEHYPLAREGAPIPSSLGSGTYFEFKVSDSVDLPTVMSGDVVFIAGLTWKKWSNPAPVIEKLLVELTRLSENPFSDFTEGGWDRLMRVWTVEDLVAEGDTLEKQGAFLGRGVVGAFKEISERL